jgi:diguanylate cyclase (GGDEF)-like protein
MTNAQTLLALIVIQQCLLAVVWLGAAGLGLTRWPALHFGAAAVGVAAGLAAVVGRDAGVVPTFVPGLVGIVAYAALRRGMQVFCGLPSRDREQACLLGLSAAGLCLASATGQNEWVLTGIVSLSLAWSILRATREAWPCLSAEFGRGAAITCLAPLLLIGIIFAVRALLAPVFTLQVGRFATSGGTFNAALGLSVLALTLLKHLGLGAMVVLRTVSQLRQLSDHDALTGVFNRRGLSGQHDRERNRLRRGGVGYALLLIDIDHFKRINDEHGHGVGDAVLVAAAQTMKAAMRPGDVLARTGGEEFSVLLSDVDPTQAWGAAQRLREAVRDETIEVEGRRLKLTCSIGVAWTQDPEIDLVLLSRRADDAMYRAKSLGRDRVAAADVAAAA